MTVQEHACYLCSSKAFDAIARECAALPVLDRRPADEILGYDDQGLPR